MTRTTPDADEDLLQRIAAAFDIARDRMLAGSVICWVAAFSGFAIVFGPLLATRRK